MKNIVLGTAGHVDHGKTTLVKRLSGIDTDRLKEEKDRGITIELGFAPFRLPDGQLVGIVDVPGHEKFIKNMLAGASGIDLVMFVIAADDGIMPQTREHMDILRLLGVDHGLVALTKCDAVEEEWLELVREDVHEFIAGSCLRNAPIIEVSALTGYGIPELQEALCAMCKEVAERSTKGACRLAVDRVFSQSGFGTVVTGTLWGGSISTGDSLEIYPSQTPVRVRSLQVHGDKRDTVYAGERVAINLSGVEKAQINRGNWLAAVGLMQQSHRIDVHLELLSSAPEMKQRTRVHVHHGTAEVLARVNLLDREVLLPGESCFAQLELEEPLSALPGDRVVLRFYSPLFTIGGGVVLDPVAVKHKRFRSDILEYLEALHSGEPGKILCALMDRKISLWTAKDAAKQLHLPQQEAAEIVNRLVSDGNLQQLDNEYAISGTVLLRTMDKLSKIVAEYHQKWPMRFGMPKKELAQEIIPEFDQKQQKCFWGYVTSNGKYQQDEKNIWISDWEPVLSENQRKIISEVLALYDEARFSPPQWSDVVSELKISASEHSEILYYMIRSGLLLRISDDVYYTASSVEQAKIILRSCSPDGSYTLAEARDTLQTTRKYAQQLCDYLDASGATIWDGERHHWRNNQ